MAGNAFVKLTMHYFVETGTWHFVVQQSKAKAWQACEPRERRGRIGGLMVGIEGKRVAARVGCGKGRRQGVMERKG